MREAVAKGAKQQNCSISNFVGPSFCKVLWPGANFFDPHPELCIKWLYVWYVWHNMQCNGMRQGTSLLALHQPSPPPAFFPASLPLSAHTSSPLPASLPCLPLYQLALGGCLIQVLSLNGMLCHTWHGMQLLDQPLTWLVSP